MAKFGSGEVMGAEVIPATPKIAQEYGYRNLDTGLIVTEIRDGSIADRDGLEVGDVLESAAGRELTSAQQLNLILEYAREQNQIVRIQVRRGNKRMLMVVRDQG